MSAILFMNSPGKGTNEQGHRFKVGYSIGEQIDSAINIPSIINPADATKMLPKIQKIWTVQQKEHENLDLEEVWSPDAEIERGYQAHISNCCPLCQ